MADQKATALSAFTPVLSDILYGVDDPGGTPVSGKVTLTAVRDLLQANLTTADASTGYDINSEVSLRSGGANVLEQRNSTNAQTFNIYNTRTDASNYERGFLKWDGNIFKIGTERAGTGVNRELRLVTNGQDRWLIAGNGVLAPVGAKDIGSTGAPVRDIVLNGVLYTKDTGELTIATGAVTATGSYHTVDTEGDAASDDLDTINGGADGQWLVIQAENGARTVVAKDGTGNLQLSADFTMDNAQDTLTLIYSGALSAWCEISRSDNGT